MEERHKGVDDLGGVARILNYEGWWHNEYVVEDMIEEDNFNLRSGVLFSEERESIATRESTRVSGLEKGEKRTPDTITARVVCRQCRIWTFL